MTRVRLIEGTDLAAHAEGIRQGYAHVFAAPPWNEDPSAGALYVERLADDAARPGFTAALALDGATVGGFATAWTTPVVFPSGRSYGHAAQALGPDRVTAWLCGALEVDELAVSPERAAPDRARRCCPRSPGPHRTGGAGRSPPCTPGRRCVSTGARAGTRSSCRFPAGRD